MIHKLFIFRRLVDLQSLQAKEMAEWPRDGRVTQDSRVARKRRSGPEMAEWPWDDRVAPRWQSGPGMAEWPHDGGLALRWCSGSEMVKWPQDGEVALRWRIGHEMAERPIVIHMFPKWYDIHMFPKWYESHVQTYLWICWKWSVDNDETDLEFSFIYIVSRWWLQE